MKKINEILELTPEEYETERFNAYWNWCEKLTTTVLETQKVLAFSPINRLYNTELIKWENEFLFRVSRFLQSPTVKKEDKKRLYTQCIEDGSKRLRPIPLIEQAIYTRPKNLTLNLSIAYVCVRGVKLDSITLRLN